MSRRHGAATNGALILPTRAYVQIHPTCIPQSGHYQSKLTLMSESFGTTDASGFRKKKGTNVRPIRFLMKNAIITWSVNIRASATSFPAMWLPATPRWCAMKAGGGVDWKGCLPRLSVLQLNVMVKSYIRDKYGNLFEMYERITGENPYKVPMRIYPAVHYTMGGLWVDYNLMSTIPGLHVIGEANFSDHGANRLGASALMQGLSDGYFVLPYTLGEYIATNNVEEGRYFS